MLPTIQKYDSFVVSTLVAHPEDKPEKHALKERVNGQQPLMNCSPFKKERILSGDRLQSPDLDWQSAKTNSLVLYDKENSPFSHSNDIEYFITAAVKAGIPHKYTSAVNEFFKKGKIDLDQAVELLNKPDQELIFKILSNLVHDTALFKTAIPFFEVLRPALVYDLLTTKDCRSLIPLDDPQVFIEVIPLLEGWDKIMLDKIFSVFTGRLSRQYFPLRDPNTLEAAFCLFKKVSPDVAAKFFCVLVSCGSSFCDREGAWITIMPCFKELAPKVAVRIFKALAEQGIWIYPWQFPKVFNAGIPFLESLKTEPETLVEFFAILNEKGLPILHHQRICEAAIPFLIGLPTDLQIGILSIRDSEGNPILMFHQMYETLIPLFKTLSRDLLIRIFSITDDDGKIPLNDHEMFETMIPLLETLDDETLLDILSVTNAEGKIALNDPYVFEMAIPFLQSRGDKILVRIFSITNVGGWTVLNNPNVFEVATPFLETREEEVLIGILSITDADGWTPLDYSPVFEAAIPLLQALKLKNKWDVVLRILSILNQNNTTCLFNRPVFDAAISFLMELESADLLEVFSIKDRDGIPFLMYPRMWEVMIPYFETLDTKVLIMLFSIVYYYKNSRTYPEVWEKAKPFVDKLDMEVKLRLPILKDLQHKFLMSRQLIG